MGAVFVGCHLAFLAGGLIPSLTLVENVTEPIIFLCYPKQQVFTIVTKGLSSLFLVATMPLILLSARFCLSGLLLRGAEPKTWQWLGMGIVMLLIAAVLASAVESLGVMFDFFDQFTFIHFSSHMSQPALAFNDQSSIVRSPFRK
jgi:hypothetical protein